MNISSHHMVIGSDHSFQGVSTQPPVAPYHTFSDTTFALIKPFPEDGPLAHKDDPVASLTALSTSCV